jgi:hypothetical protein
VDVSENEDDREEARREEDRGDEDLRMTTKGRAVIDGPFTESNELIGGFVIMEVPSMEAAVTTAIEYAETLLLAQDAVEVDVRVAR